MTDAPIILEPILRISGRDGIDHLGARVFELAESLLAPIEPPTNEHGEAVLDENGKRMGSMRLGPAAQRCVIALREAGRALAAHPEYENVKQALIAWSPLTPLFAYRAWHGDHAPDALFETLESLVSHHYRSELPAPDAQCAREIGLFIRADWQRRFGFSVPLPDTMEKALKLHGGEIAR